MRYELFFFFFLQLELRDKEQIHWLFEYLRAE